MPVLVSFTGLPGVGKSTIARQLAKETGALWLWVDEIEAAMTSSEMEIQSMEDGGYAAARAMAKRALLQGFDVIADCVNPIELARDAWDEVATEAKAEHHTVAIHCSDEAKHKHRVDTRVVDLEGWQPPTWEQVSKRKMTPFDSEMISLDTSELSVTNAVAKLRVLFKSRELGGNR